MSLSNASANNLESPERWLDLYGDLLFRFALARTGDSSVAEDLVQETFLAALHSRHRFQQRASVRTWLTAILKHKIIDFMRRRGRENLVIIEEEPEEALDRLFNRRGHWEAGAPAWANIPSKHLEQKEFLDTVFRCLAELPPRIARIFTLREMDGLETGTICQVMEITATNCWTMLYRARVALQRCLDRNWFNRPDEGGTPRHPRNDG